MKINGRVESQVTMSCRELWESGFFLGGDFFSLRYCTKIIGWTGGGGVQKTGTIMRDVSNWMLSLHVALHLSVLMAVPTFILHILIENSSKVVSKKKCVMWSDSFNALDIYWIFRIFFYFYFFMFAIFFAMWKILSINILVLKLEHS